MKIHLPSGLRKALLSCLACMSGMAAFTVSTGSIFGTAACLFALSSTAQAEQYSDTTVDLNADASDGIYQFTNAAGQTATVAGELSGSELKLDNNVNLTLAGDANARLNVGQLTLTGTSTLTLNAQNVLNLRDMNFSVSAGSRIVANFGGAAVNMRDFISERYTGAFEIRNGSFNLSADDHYTFSELKVVGNNGRLYLNEEASYTINNLHLTGGSNTSNGVLQMAPGATLEGSIVLDGDTYIRPTSNSSAIVINASITGNNRILYVAGDIGQEQTEFRGTISGVSQLISVNYGQVHVYSAFSGSQNGLRQENRTQLKTGNNGTINFYDISGFQDFMLQNSSVVNIWNEYEAVDGASENEKGFILMRQSGHLYFKNKITNLARIQLNHKDNHFYIDGDVVGRGDTISVTGGVGDDAGTLYITGDITWEGKLSLQGGKTYFGDGTRDTDTNSLNFSEIEVLNGAVFKIRHSATDNSQTDITSGNGIIYMEDMDALDNPMKFGTLTINEGTSSFIFKWNGGLGFTELTGEGNISVEKDPTVVSSTELSSLVFYDVHNYNGTVSWANGVSETAKSIHKVKISDVHQDAEYEATFNLRVYSEAFHKMGEGTLTLAAGMNASQDFWMVYEGTLNITGSITMENNTVLHYGDGTTLTYLDKAGRLKMANSNARLFIYTEELDLEALLTTGVDLHISSRDIVRSKILAIGLTSSEYTIEEDLDTGTWWIKATTAPHSGDKGTDGIWDIRWDNELYTRPLTGNIPIYSNTEENTDAYLAGNSAYQGRTSAGNVYWAQFTRGSLDLMQNIVGGTLNKNNSPFTDKVEADIWISVVDGDWYGDIVGGNATALWQSAKRIDFEGDTHIIINAPATLEEGMLVNNVIGGNLGDGPGQSNGSTFTGNTFISIMGNTKVWGGVVGGSVAFHDGAPTFKGDTHVYIYNVQEDYEMDIPLLTSEGIGQMMPQVIVGGNARLANVTNVFAEGNTLLYIDTANAYSYEGAQFSKQIIAGDYVCGPSYGGSMERVGNTQLTITRASGVTFTKDIIGGSFDVNGVSTSIEGNTDVRITSGIYDAMVTGGSFRATMAGAVGVMIVDGDTSLTLSGGTFNGRDYKIPPVVEEDEELEDGENANGGLVTPDPLPFPMEPEEEPPVTIGSIAVVGGNLIVDATEEQPENRRQTVLNSVTGTSTLTITGGNYNGHVVASSVMQAYGGIIGSHEQGGTVISMKGGSINGTSRLVGGMLLDVPATAASDDAEVSIGDVSITIGGSARVNDVIGGSWLNGVNADRLTVQQGDVSIALENGATVRGDVYAGGIQGGSTGMSTESVHISIGSKVNFSKEDGSDTIVSAGYLSTKDEAADSAYGSYYANAGKVTGESVLTLDNADYGDLLTHVRLLNFTKLELGKNTVARLRALTAKESGEDIIVTGGGMVVLDATLLTDVVDTESGDIKNMRSNSSMVLTEGSSLRITNSNAANHTSFIEKIVASDGSNIEIDLARPEGGNDTLQVLKSIVMEGNSVLTINFNGTAAMEKYPLIRQQNSSALPDEHGTGPVLELNDTHVHLNISYLESALLTGKDVRLVVAESVSGNFEGDESLSESLRKWFTGNAEAVIEERSDIRQLVLRGKTVDSETADYHTSKSITINGRVGARMLDNLYTTVNPEATDPYGDRTALLNALEEMMAARDYEGADRTMAAAAGSALPAMALALGDDVERQLRSIRNRTTTVGLDEDYDYGDMPQMSFWINSEGDFHKVRAEGTFSGYKMNSWGGTVGVGAETSHQTSVGLALTAIYGKLTIDSPDSASGHLMTAYLSGFMRHRQGAWTHTLVATVGLADADVTRTVDYGSGRYAPKADANGYTVGVMYEVGYSVMLNESGSACVQPVVNVMWSHSQLNDFTEGGSDAGLDVSGLSHDNLVVGAGVRFQALTGGETYNRSSLLEARVMLKSYLADRDASADVNFQGAKRVGTVRTVETGDVGVEVGAGLTVPMHTERPSSIFMDVSAELRNAYTNFNATIGWKTSF